MFAFPRYIRQITIVVGVLSLFFLSFIGITHYGMSGMDEMSSMSACPFMPGGAVCNMTPLQHIAAAQNMFNVFPQGNAMLALLLLLASVLAIMRIFKKEISPPLLRTHILLFRRLRTIFPTALQEAFASGILHPKTF